MGGRVDMVTVGATGRLFRNAEMSARGTRQNRREKGNQAALAGVSVHWATRPVCRAPGAAARPYCGPNARLTSARRLEAQGRGERFMNLCAGDGAAAAR